MRRALTLFALLIAAPALVAIVGAEAFLRVFDLANMRAGWRTAHELDQSHAKPSSINQLGYRGQRFEIAPGDFVIVLVGDSQVECLACRDGHMPGDLLREAIAPQVARPVKVFSLGASAFGADQELLALRSYFRAGYRADLVVVWQTLENDLYNAVFPNMAPVFGAGKLKPTFRLAPDGRLIEPAGDIGSLFCRFYLSCVYRQYRYGSMDAYFEQWLPAPVAPIGEPLSGTQIVDAGEAIDHEKSTWALWLPDPSPRSRYAIDLTRALYRSMSDLAGAHGARFTLFGLNRLTAIGQQELSGYPFFRDGPKTIRHNSKLYAVGGHEMFFRTVRAVNDGFPAVLVDMDIPDHVVSPQDGHLNERGNAHAMKHLAEEIIKRGLIR